MNDLSRCFVNKNAVIQPNQDFSVSGRTKVKNFYSAFLNRLDILDNSIAAKRRFDSIVHPAT